MFREKVFGGERSLLIANLKEALDGKLCPICKLAGDAGRRYLDMLLHERVNDGGTRQQLARSHGFCALHTDLLLETGGYGCHAKIALLYKDQVDVLAEAMAQLPDKGDITGEMTSDCRVCRSVARTEALYTELLADRLRQEAIRASYRAGPALCLRHFCRVYDVAEPPVRTFLRESHAARLRGLSQDLAEFVRKSVSANQGDPEPFGAERDAWLRALRLYAGALRG